MERTSESGLPVDPVYDASKPYGFPARRKAWQAGRVSIYSRCVSADVRGPPLDDAPVRRVRQRPGVQPALPRADRGGHHRALGRLRPAHPDGLRLRREGRARRGGQGRRGPSTPSATCAPCSTASAGDRVHVDDDQRARRRAAAHVPDRRRGAGHAVGPTDRDDPERRAEGSTSPAAPYIFPPRPVAAAGRGHVRLLSPRAAPVEHDLHLRVPHGRGGRHARAGGRVYAGQRQGVRPGRAGLGPGRRRLRPPALVLLRGQDHAARGGGEVPRRAAAVGRAS